jgi:hypothetical protein
MAARHAAIKVEGLNELLRDLGKLPKETQRNLRKRSFDIAEEVASGVRGWLGTAQAAPLLERVRAKNDRVPNVRVGGEARANVSGGARLGDLMGANFGSGGRYKQFPPTRRPDYYVYTLIQHRSADITRAWVDAVNAALMTVDPGHASTRG